MEHFSLHEQDVLKILGRKKLSIHEISDKFYGTETDMFSRNYVASIVRRIRLKCIKQKLTWTLLGEGTGRGGTTVWRGKRRRSNGARTTRKKRNRASHTNGEKIFARDI